MTEPDVYDGKHDCPYRGCARRLPYHILACRTHWARVSRTTQSAVYRAWRAGPTGEYLDVRAQAVEEMNAGNPIKAVTA